MAAEVTEERQPSSAAPTKLLTGREDLLPRSAIPVLLVAAFALFSILKPELFFTWTNVRLMVSAQATTVLLAVAATIPLRAGDFDLSISAVMIASGAVVGVLYKHGVPAWACIVIGLLMGLLVGAVNSFFVVYAGLDGLIVTLGMLTLLTGLTSFVSSGQLVSTVPAGLEHFAEYKILSLPSVVWVGWIVVGVTWFVFEFTPFGRYVLFLGGNRNAATLAGLRVPLLRTFGLLASAGIAAVAGILLAGSLGTIDPSSGGSYLLPPFTAAFLGTTTLQLGRFNVLGTVVGLYLLAVGITGLQLLGVQGWVSDVFNGAALVLAIAFARLLRSDAITQYRSKRAKPGLA